tara:strand:+ start:81 stop:887 length:807 start_codon:yes stop_codon:yes gene_type:complete
MKRHGKSKGDFKLKPHAKAQVKKRENYRVDKDIQKIRLNKFIANTGVCSRREADKFIEAGVISVNGLGITELGYKISSSDIIKFNGQKLKSETLKYVLLNKPKNYSGRINSGTKTTSVMSLISSACKEKIFPVDKLSKLETGLLIFTNDTALAKKIGNKKQIIKSIYQITLDKHLTQKDLLKIREGVFIDKKKNPINSISYIKNKPKNEIGIEHNRGGVKYIKEIFQKLNYHITKLDRVFLGGLTKKNLPRKHYRHLNQDEINILKRL